MSKEETHLSREEIAKRDIGHTDVSPSVKVFLFAVCLVSIFGVVAVQHALGVREHLAAVGRGETSSLTTTPSLRFYRQFDGLFAAMSAARRQARTKLDHVLASNRPVMDRIRAFQQAIDDSTWLAVVSRSPVQAALCRLGAGNEKALLGRDGWLYYDPAVTAVTGPAFLDPDVVRRRRNAGINADPVPAIVWFREQLKARGIELVVMPTPSKVSVVPGGLAKRPPEVPVLNPSYGPFVERLQKAGVLVFDCAVPLSTRPGSAPAYLKTDTHWRPETMQSAAQGLTAMFVERGLMARGTAGFVRQQVTVTNLGDIAVMLKLPAGQQLFPPEVVTVQAVRQADGSSWAPDRRAEVLLLGDSFSNIYSLREMGWGEGGGLAEQLAVELQRPVDRIVRNDSGAYATREMLARELARGEDRLAGKKVVVWQFAARELAHGDWRPGEVEMRVGSVAQQSDSIHAGQRICCTVAAVSTRPQRGAVYRDFVIKFVVTGLKDEKTGETIGDGGGVVHAMGMRNHEVMPVANAREGTVLRMRLWSWGDVKARYESLRDGDLPDPTVEVQKRHFWGEPVDGSVETVLVKGPEVAHVAAPITNVTGFLATCGRLGVEAIAKERYGLEGRGGWLFISSELRHLGAGQFWGENALVASQVKDAGACDPAPAIVDFDRQLKALGIGLLLVPVPAKAVVYPDKLSADVALDNQGLPARTDVHHQAFYRMLAEQGVQVLDLTDDFILARRDDAKEGPVYCMTDTHWAPRACALAARRIRERVAVAGRNLLGAVQKQEFATALVEKEIVGDLVEMSGATNRPPEKIKLIKVGTGQNLDPVQPDDASPVVLLADSHGLVFHAGGDLFETGAGLADHLARELGFPVDVMARRGSAATSVRIDMARRFIKEEDSRKAKKLVIWCFAARDFTESSGWRKVPLSLKK